MDDGAATTFVQGGAGDGCGAHVLLELELAFHGLLPTLVVSCQPVRLVVNDRGL